MQRLIERDGYTPHFSGHETFTLRQMWLKKAFDVSTSTVSAPKGAFVEDSAISRFGVGKNMVASIKHWALACGVFEELSEDKNSYKVDGIWAEILKPTGLDPYCENPATSWLAHWRLAGVPRGKHRTTTWWWLFNNVLSQTFSREEVVTQLKRYCEGKGQKVSESTIKRDVEACVRCYVSKADANVEDQAEVMLEELALISEDTRGTFSFVRGPKPTLPNGILDLAIFEYWDLTQSESTISFDMLAHAPGSPGRVFKLDENSLAERLLNIHQRTGAKVIWTDTAGVRQLIRNDISSLLNQGIHMDMLEAAYE
jgi:Protein of unknown function (DUF4007)